MTEQELRNHLEQMTHSIPDETHRAFVTAAVPGKEEIIMKKKISFGMVFAIVLIVLTLTACAAGIIYNQNWYFQNRGKLALESSPEIYEDVIKNMTEVQEQTQSEGSLVDVQIQDVSWAPDAKMMTVTFRAVPKDPEHYELHSMYDLDTDGSYVGEGGATDPAEDGEDRAMHWLWRVSPMFEEETRMGPPMEMMDDSGKHLLLIEGKEVRVADGSLELTGGRDMFRTPEGEVIFEAEFQLDWLDEEYDRKTQEWADQNSGEGEDLRTYAEKKITGAQKAREAVRSGKLPCVVDYTVVEYTEGMDDMELYTGGEHGQVSFVISTGDAASGN